MSPSLGRNRHNRFDERRCAQIDHAVLQIVSADPSSPPGTLANQLAMVGRALNSVSGPNHRLVRSWLLSYLQPLLETIDGQEFILEVERQQPTEGTEA